MFETVLVANRGEIACRIIRTLRSMGIRSTAIFTEADRGARHTREADAAVLVPSYLDIAAIAAIPADAVHPGYGFLSENVEFARACEAAGLVFIGPPVGAIEAMADKIRAKEHVAARGVPVIPGATGDDLVAAAATVGYPLLIKPSAGGGGKGMTEVFSPAELPAALDSARRVALKAFGDDTLLLERLVTTPRHIEVQVLADSHGTVIHLGERECSPQRRHQKIVEEAPSALLDETTRAAIGEAACEVARSVGYVGAGTVEFLVSDAAPGEFFFMEMNTRLQVEHPVTELVTGIDLVEQQVRIAAGGRVPAAPVLTGHAVEARLYSEDPAAGFLPSAGEVLALHEPEGVRVDSALLPGLVVGTAYDPMLAKIIAWAPTRAEALARLDLALADTAVLGIRTNLSFLRALVTDPEVRAGRLHTGLIEGLLPFHDPEPDAWALAAAASLRPLGTGAWALDGWRAVGTPARPHARHDDETVTVELDGEARTFRWARDAGSVWLARDGVTWQLATPDRDRREARARASGPTGPQVRSAMPGTVVSVAVRTGDVVEAGQPLLAIEAMKMEHTLLSSVAGTVTVSVAEGDQVRLDQVVATIHPHEGEPG
ncbi:MAG: acetyl/propionyl-CoA carboxylase subuit alpha [Micrococcales bacterium 70-64]|nr:biotin/lipoyl-binding protein [Leifsonia sp.]ODU64767.1 MAG: acetyl/propionyl-CoA carboxylase subuit alpha [Leifsonia sp. SCN 70-46]OJX86458.1 MAG: acetyl/propionyl-CoA carboxylase subuit alpha [Micrococcales bacterium 70-64]